MTKDEFKERLTYGSAKRINGRYIHEGGDASGSFPCYIGMGNHIYYGHFHEGKWFKHGFETEKDKYGFSTGKQIQTEEEVTGVEWYYKIK